MKRDVASAIRLLNRIQNVQRARARMRAVRSILYFVSGGAL